MSTSTGYLVGSTSTSFRLTVGKGALAAALAYLGTRDQRKLSNNTYLVRTDAGAVVRFHATNIVTIAEGKVTLSSGGYRTYTTKDRINAVLPAGYNVYTDQGIWYLSTPSGKSGKSVTFADGITLGSAGAVKGAGNAAKDVKLRKQIHKYAADYAAACVAGKVPAPSGGDCWYCCMVVAEGPDKGKPMGDVGHDSHLAGHMSKGYFVPSLLVNAAKARGNNYVLSVIGPVLWADLTDEERKARWARNPSYEREIRRVLRQYLGSRLGLALR